VMGVPVKVKEVRISPRDGKGSVRGLEIGNPTGFSAPRAARLGEIRVEIDPTTLREPVVRIRELYVDTPAITYERGNKTTNLEVIQKNIEAYVRGQTPEAPPRGQTPEAPPGKAGKSPGSVPGSESSVPGLEKRRFIIDRLAIKAARVTMTNPALKGQGLSFDLPDIEIRDLGKRQGGVTASEAAAAVTSTLQNRIAQRALTNIDTLRKGGVEGALDALKGLLK
jgi:uncharacterized protein involved in outer membrane biogenesis